MRIGELAAATGTTTKSLRFYEQAGLLPPPARSAAGYRDYTPASVARLEFIRRGQRAGLTLAPSCRAAIAAAIAAPPEPTTARSTS